MPSTNRPFPLPLPTKPLQIKQDDKFFTKLLSKETSVTNNNGGSFRIYYGDVSGAIPFTWESHPGTPKHRAFFETTTLPPLTPPPSYFSNSEKRKINKHSGSNLLRTLLLKLNPRRSRHLGLSPSVSSLSCSSWSSSSYSSMSVPGTPLMMIGTRHQFSSFGSSVSSKVNDEGEVVSPTSTLCFGSGREKINNGGSSGRSSSSAEFVKKAWLSVVGHHGNGSN